MSTTPEPLDNPATAGGDLDPEPTHAPTEEVVAEPAESTVVEVPDRNGEPVVEPDGELGREAGSVTYQYPDAVEETDGQPDASGQDAMVEATDNSGETEAGSAEDPPQDPDAVELTDSELDDPDGDGDR